MKRLLNVLVVVATLVAITIFAARSGANNPPADKPALVVAETAARNPWTKLELDQGADAFRFAVVSDRTGGHRPGVFSRAVRMINLLQPEFVMSVGDLIEGYSEDSQKIINERLHTASTTKTINIVTHIGSGMVA